jgi:hypothetical protein
MSLFLLCVSGGSAIYMHAWFQTVTRAKLTTAPYFFTIANADVIAKPPLLFPPDPPDF